MIEITTPRRFHLIRKEDETGVSGVGVVAEGLEFTDGSVAMRWLTGTASTAVYASIDDVRKIHGHGGKTVVMWLDTEMETASRATRANYADVWDEAWNKIKELTKRPIAFVINTVYNKGVRGLWNAAAKVLPIDKLPAFKPKGFARGGAVFGPGSETSDSILAMDQCPVCDGPLTTTPLALVFVGIAPEDRKPSGYTTGAAVAAHAECVGLDPEETL